MKPGDKVRVAHDLGHEAVKRWLGWDGKVTQVKDYTNTKGQVTTFVWVKWHRAGDSVLFVPEHLEVI